MEKDNEIKHNIAHTYAEDMAEVIEGDKSGLVKKIIQGEQEHEMEKSNLSPESRKNKFFMWVGILCFGLSIALLSFLLLKKEAPTVPVAQQFTPLIFNDTSTSLDVAGFSKDLMVGNISNLGKAAALKQGGVGGIYLINNNKNVGLREFLKLLKSSFIPGDLNLVSDNFLLGVVNGATKDFFMLLKVRSIIDIFDSLRAYENTMFSDLHGFFGKDISAETKYLLTANFTDGIVENKNARILYDKDGSIVMMYVFADDNSVVITNTIAAAHEIMLRLAATKVKK